MRGGQRLDTAAGRTWSCAMAIPSLGRGKNGSWKLKPPGSGGTMIMNPTRKRGELRTINNSCRNGEWFSYRVRAVGQHLQFWINDKLVMTYDDAEYKSGHFAIQGHNPGMKVEAKDLYYLDLSK